MSRNASPADLTATEPGKYPPQFDAEIVKAIHWCRLGRVRPDDESAFHKAKQLGLLAQDSVWRATERGEGVLIALGLLDGAPVPPRTRVEALWATCPRFPTPRYVTSWPEGLADMMPEEAADQREQAEKWFRSFGDEVDWSFFTTSEFLDRPEAPDAC